MQEISKIDAGFEQEDVTGYLEQFQESYDDFAEETKMRMSLDIPTGPIDPKTR